jgi:beta-fructofuranosidase
MYASHGFLRSDIGDVDVIYHDGLYHLFHLVLPNHDFIAHAVSEDAMSWRRVKNALFVGDPGSWDDDMLWTMHVTPDPDREGEWRMFYTGLSRAEYGRIQRIGLARSKDLYHWERCVDRDYPLEMRGPSYESSVDEGRQWVSFRDPYFFIDEKTGARLLLASGRVKTGPVIRRGCVALAREISPDRFEFIAPLHKPGLYDDVEVPNLFWLNDRYYLIGSIREDIKIHYWYSERLEGPYENFFDNVLLPFGNYAARVCQNGGHPLLFCFFARTEMINGREVTKKVLPPPKELVQGRGGRLRLKSSSRFDDLVTGGEDITAVAQCRFLYGNSHAAIKDIEDGLHFSCRSGYEAFLLPGHHSDFRLRCILRLEGSGKCGLVIRINGDGDGYYLSLDLVKGHAQLRAWGANPTPVFEHSFRYEQLQDAHFQEEQRESWPIEVVAHGMYLEVSIGGYVVLSLVDEAFADGAVGFYAESASLAVSLLRVESLSRPVTEHASEMVYTATRPDPQDQEAAR